MQRSKHPRFCHLNKRNDSFDDCKAINNSKETLAEAGFFYAGNGDCTRCFHCGIGNYIIYFSAIAFYMRRPFKKITPWVKNDNYSFQNQVTSSRKSINRDFNSRNPVTVQITIT